jgi:hypothetical protein
VEAGGAVAGACAIALDGRSRHNAMTSDRVVRMGMGRYRKNALPAGLFEP